MSPRLLSIGLLGLIACASSPSDSFAPAPERASTNRPNIVLIVADDLGWTDVVANDPLGRSYYSTPNLDRLSAEGVRFPDAYAAAANCAPSRAALVTGLPYPAQPIYTVGSGARGRRENRALVPPPNVRDLPTEFTTLAERLQTSGYATWFLGKWHLGSPGEHGPLEQGYEVNVGGNRAGHPKSYFAPYRNPNLGDGPDGEHLTERLGREACALIEQHAGERPFFCHLAPYAVHTPLQAPEEARARFEEREPDRGHKNPKYAAMIEALDRAVGRVLAALDDCGIADETLVVFTSDNGGMGGYVAEGLGGRDITSLAPLRGGKGMFYEGGIRVPFFVRWPGVTRPGTSFSRAELPISQLDLLPTLCSVAGAPLAADATHGIDLTPVLEGRVDALERELVWYFPGYLERGKTQFRTRPVVVRRAGPWKYLRFLEDGREELYDLSRDLGESRNLARDEPELTVAMREAVERWLDRHDAPRPRTPSMAR